MPSGRWNRGAWLFRDETSRMLSKSCSMKRFAFPALGFASGLTASSDSFPGLGDVARRSALAAIIPLAAWFRGVPYVTLARMAVNLGIERARRHHSTCLATSSTSRGRPIAATIACAAPSWRSRGATPGGLGLSSVLACAGLALIFAIPIVLVDLAISAGSSIA